MSEAVIHQFEVKVWLPTTPPRPAPALLTEEEACVMLFRQHGPGERRSLAYYRRAGKLTGRRVGSKLQYLLADILRFLNEV